MQEFKVKFSEHVKKLQNQITEKMQDLDIEIELIEDVWSREDFNNNPGGGGITRAFQGNTFENAGVNTSQIFGDIDPKFAASLNGEGSQLWASGISLIIHPHNPKIPTVHANFRMIEQGGKYWFGGGADLTPYYPYEEDFRYFHGVWKAACAPYNCYQEMKVECDQYFTNYHRGGEMRGIGGIFFDHFNSGDIEKDFAMVKDLSSHFINSYFPLVEKRIKESFTEEDKDFQLHRRGRYVEFNLIHDRGTLFGLKTKGRVDSILISLPGTCKFTYKYAPKPGSAHEKMMEYYKPQEW
ncbi:MAG: oxygen-dependent coproporphyrinogen oxidase [Halobacteriovoraceae bacterium]|nr:oxygen-dependent coproporphyrinogen oxidase [Halobacteriovoraceae bacterium]|tara:strand:- start:2038 stop:2925 length:888 start_codon:yes stop_codon:yes gene_type:complete